jgi:hypothetical protein
MEDYFRKADFLTSAIAREINSINQTSYREVFGRAKDSDYLVYFSNKNLYEAKVADKEKVITVFLQRRGGKTVTDDFISSFTTKLQEVLQGVLSQSAISYSPFSYKSLGDSSFLIISGGSSIKVEVKRHFDPYQKERMQVGALADFLGKLNNEKSGNEIVFKILNDTYRVDTSIIHSANSMVDYLKNNERADVQINVNLGRSSPVKISLKWDTFRQFSGVNEFRGIKQIDDFIEKVSLRYQLGEPHTKLYETLIDPGYSLTQRVVFSEDVDYLMIGDITMVGEGNTIGATEGVYRRGQYREKLYIVSSNSTDKQYGIPGVRFGIYNKKYGGVYDMSTTTVFSLRQKLDEKNKSNKK